MNTSVFHLKLYFWKHILCVYLKFCVGPVRTFGAYCRTDLIQEHATDVLNYVLMAAKNREHKFSLRYPSTEYYELLVEGPSSQALLTCCSHLSVLMRLEMEIQEDPPHELDMRMEGVLFEILLLLIWFSGMTLRDLAYAHHKRMEPGLYVETQSSSLLWDTSCKRLYKD